MTAFPDTGGSDGLTLRCHLDRRDDRLGNIDQRLVLEVELEGLGEVGERLVHGWPLADNGDLDATGHEPVVVGGDHGRQVQGRRGLSHDHTIVGRGLPVEEGRPCGKRSAWVTQGRVGATTG